MLFYDKATHKMCSITTVKMRNLELGGCKKQHKKRYDVPFGITVAFLYAVFLEPLFPVRLTAHSTDQCFLIL